MLADIPTDILFCEICKYVGSAGRRMLALTCKTYLQTLPGACGRKIAAYRKSKYKLMGEKDDFLRIRPNSRITAICMIYAAARCGKIPKCFYDPAFSQLIDTLSPSDVLFVSKIAYRRGHTDVVNRLRLTRNYGWPLLAISRGHYQVAKDCGLYNTSIYAHDCDHITEPGVFEYVFRECSWLLSVNKIHGRLAAVGGIKQLCVIDKLNVSIKYHDVACVAAQHKQWDTVDYALLNMITNKSIIRIQNVVSLLVCGACERVAAIYPDLLKAYTYDQYVQCSNYSNVPFSARLSMFTAAATKAQSFAHALEMWFDCTSILRHIDVICQYVRDSPEECVVPYSIISLDVLLPLFKAGAKPADDAYAKRIYSTCQETFNPAFEEIVEVFRSQDIHTIPVYVSAAIKQLEKKPDLSTDTRSLFIKVAYLLDNVDLLAATIGTSKRYPHSKHCHLLSSNSRIQQWRQIRKGLDQDATRSPLAAKYKCRAVNPSR